MAPSQAALMVFEARLKNRGARPWLPDLNDTAMNQATYDVVHAKLLEEGLHRLRGLRTHVGRRTPVHRGQPLSRHSGVHEVTDRATTVLTENADDLLRYFRRRVGDHDALDLLADTLMTALRRSPSSRSTPVRPEPGCSASLTRRC